MSNKYAILMETNGKHLESWYYFIKYEGNEDALDYFQRQLKKIDDMYIIDDLSTFDLELNHLVSKETAIDMCSVDLNPFSPHRMFNGRLKKINFDFSKRDSDEEKIEKMNEKISHGDIDKYIDDEVIFDDNSDKKEDDLVENKNDEKEDDNCDEEEAPPSRHNKKSGKKD